MTTLYRKILVPLDGSSLAERILAYLPRLVRPEHTELVLVSVVEAWRYPLGFEDVASPSLTTSIHASAQAYVKQQREHLQDLGYRVHTHIVNGDAAQSILEAATMVGADLIAMTTHGRSGFVRWALGSVTERVVHDTKLPILLVRETMNIPTSKIQHILVPLDGSANAEQALPEAQALAQATGAKILLLQVIQSLDQGSRKILFASETAAEVTFAQWRSAAEQYLIPIAAGLQDAGIATEHRIIFGDPDQTILKTVADETIDLIVMTTHGRTGLKRWFYGSVTNKVLRGISGPLLLVRNR